MENRRQTETPFKAIGTEITCAAGRAVVVADSPELARFIVLACNRYDLFMALFDLCRGEIEGVTLPYRAPAHKAFAALAKQLHEDIAAHGR